MLSGGWPATVSGWHWQRGPVGIKIGITRGAQSTLGATMPTILISNLLEATPGIEPGIAVLQTASS